MMLAGVLATVYNRLRPFLRPLVFDAQISEECNLHHWAVSLMPDADCVGYGLVGCGKRVHRVDAG